MATIVSGHSHIWEYNREGTITCGTTCVRAQSGATTNMSGHKRVWVDTNASVYKRIRAQRVRAQICLGTIGCFIVVCVKASRGLNVWSANQTNPILGV